MNKRQIVGLLVFSCLIFISSLGFASTVGTDRISLSSKINHIINRYNANLNIGVLVQSLDTGKVLYARNADHLFVPASTLKIFTAAAALKFLGPEFRFQTKLFATTNKIIDGVLTGDLYFYFDGDPTLKRRSLQTLIAYLSKNKIREIKGNIYIDDTVFDQAYFGPGWMWDECNFCYAAPASAISIDGNCFAFSLMASISKKRPVRVVKESLYNFIPITNATTLRSGAKDICPLVLRGERNKNSYYLSGCIKKSALPAHFLVAVRNMRVYGKGIIKKLFYMSDIKVDGRIIFKKLPNSDDAGVPLILLETHNSAPLNKLIKKMLKKSDNLIANALYKKLGAEVFSRAGTWKNGSKALKIILAKSSHINFHKMRVVDGCGLSRYNLISPRSLVLLLKSMYNDQKNQEGFLWVMPTYKLTKNPHEKISAKTGTMRGITSLAGYAFTKRGKVLVFAIMANNFVEKVRRYRALENEICQVLVKI